MTKRHLRPCWLFAVLLLAGCALSPQQVRLAPDLKANARLQNAPAIQIRVEDQRPSDIIGTRGGLYGNTSHLRAANDLELTLAQQASQAFKAMGARLAGSAPIQLTLYIERLSYQSQRKALIQEVSLESQVRAVAERANERHEGRFQSRQVHRFLTLPNERDNERILNAILEETLNRLINDPELIRFLQR